MKTPTLILLACLLAFAACKNRTSPPPSPPEIDPPAASCKAVEEGRVPKSDPLMRIAAEIREGCLVVTATYSGGCKDHEFRLFWNGLWAESMPPQTGLTLVHNANEDNCRAIKSSELSFDLSKIKYEGVNEVSLGINAEGLENGLRIIYKY